MNLEELLDVIRKTNPEMTMEKMIYELKQCQYSSKALIYTEKNYKLENN